MPRGHAQRPAGLFRPDRQYRFARPGPRGLTLDRGDGTGGGERASLCPAGEQWAQADAQARRAERRRGRDVGLRDPLSIGAPLRQPHQRGPGPALTAKAVWLHPFARLAQWVECARMVGMQEDRKLWSDGFTLGPVAVTYSCVLYPAPCPTGAAVMLSDIC